MPSRNKQTPEAKICLNVGDELPLNCKLDTSTGAQKTANINSFRIFLIRIRYFLVYLATNANKNSHPATLNINQMSIELKGYMIGDSG